MQMQELVFEELWGGSDQRCCLWALLISRHFTANFLHALFTFGFLLFTPGLIQSLCQAAGQIVSGRKISVDFRGTSLHVKGEESDFQSFSIPGNVGDHSLSHHPARLVQSELSSLLY